MPGIDGARTSRKSPYRLDYTRYLLHEVKYSIFLAPLNLYYCSSLLHPKWSSLIYLLCPSQATTAQTNSPKCPLSLVLAQDWVDNHHCHQRQCSFDFPTPWYISRLFQPACQCTSPDVSSARPPQPPRHDDLTRVWRGREVYGCHHSLCFLCRFILGTRYHAPEWYAILIGFRLLL